MSQSLFYNAHETSITRGNLYSTLSDQHIHHYHIARREKKKPTVFNNVSRCHLETKHRSDAEHSSRSSSAAIFAGFVTFVRFLISAEVITGEGRNAGAHEKWSRQFPE
ncbi:hypothetical protein PQX77_018314 [Marasmius sp. AFHP31]|nr:hypothetical protein PQX77_018314 [Marasmius sp. AFHP31]